MTLTSLYLSKLQKNKNDFITSLEKLTPKLKHKKFIEIFKFSKKCHTINLDTNLQVRNNTKPAV